MMVHIKFPDDHIIGLHMELFSRTTLVIALDALSLLFFIFINSTAYHLGRYKASPPSTKELHGLHNEVFFSVNYGSAH